LELILSEIENYFIFIVNSTKQLMFGNVHFCKLEENNGSWPQLSLVAVVSML
jgi:hypothetical protein